jgi:hypothetical protein
LVLNSFHSPMTIPIKIECECGLRYAFEVEPVNGHVPTSVVCPSCGVDGTVAADAILAEILQRQSTSATTPTEAVTTEAAPVTAGAAAARAPLRVSLPPSHVPSAAAGSAGSGRDRRSGAGLLPGQTTRVQAQHEARAKMLWGEPPLQVLAYLLTQGFSREDASELVQEFLRERIRTIRLKGIKYTCTGAALLFFPAVAALSYWLSGHFPRSRAVGFLGALGILGAWFLFKGIGLVIWPGSDSGDAAEEVEPDSLFD